MLSLVLAFAAGGLSTLSRCVLPLIPILVATALRSGRAAPLALASGLVVSFAAVGNVLSAVGVAATTSESIRLIGAVLLALFGLVLLVPRLRREMWVRLQPFSAAFGPLMAALPGNGLIGQFLVGAVVGLVWSPCTGPALGAAVGLAAATGTFALALVTMIFYGMGAAVPLLAVAYLGQAGSKNMARGRKLATIGTPIFGSALLVTALLVLTGADRIVETSLTSRLPTWLVDLTTRF